MAERGCMMEAGKEDRTPFQIAEKCLYDYKLNLSKIDTLRKKLSLLGPGSTLKAQSYEQRYGGGDPPDPVAQRTERIDSMERQIIELEIKTAPLTQMIKDLDEGCVLEGSQNKSMLQLLEARYFFKGKWPQVSEKLHTSVANLKKWRSRLVTLAIDYLCL